MRKPGAFRSYVFREALFPTLEFRRAYDALLAHSLEYADLEYLRILHLAATDGESAVRETLAQLLCSATPPTYEAVRARVRGPYIHAGVPHLQVRDPDLSAYDRLLSGAADAAVCA